MKAEELQKMAQKLQLKVKSEEIPTYLEIFDKLEELLTNFRQVKLRTKTKSLTRINVGYLTLKDLEKMKKKFFQTKIGKKTFQNNAIITSDNFVLFRNN